MKKSLKEIIAESGRCVPYIYYKNKEKRKSFDESFGQEKMELIRKVIGNRGPEIAKRLEEQNELIKKKLRSEQS